ncbi:MAG: alginate export family protein [Planctomycetes bacterium]|nr:alginate export family protein [Planctomycetota bacterium]
MRLLSHCLALTLLWAACAGAPTPTATPDLPVAGDFVEAEGTFLASSAVIEELDRLERADDDKGDKVEVTAPILTATPTAVHLLGHEFRIDDDTEFEDADKRHIAPFAPAIGEWVRIKARSDERGLRARTVRKMAVRERHKVVGELRHLDLIALRADIGGIVLPIARELVAGAGREDDDPLAAFVADDQKGVPFTVRVSDSVRLGGQLSGNLEHKTDYDLDATDPGDREGRELRGKLDVLWSFDRGSYLLAEVSGGLSDTIREADDDTHRELLELTRAVASIRLSDELQIYAGRQDFTDEREWLFDEVLDGARLRLRSGALDLEAGGAVGRDVLAEPHGLEDVALLTATARWHLDDTWRLAAYWAQRHDDAGFEPRLLGIRSYARPRTGLGHWFDLAHAGGDDGQRPIDGIGLDLGAQFTFDTDWKPTLFAGFAYGSGRRDGESHTGFRQTGLQDNNGKLGGVTKVRYYGEVLDPELANLLVTTVGASIRPLRDLSFTILIHGYGQDVGSTQTPGTDLRTQPRGTATEFGREIDLVIGYRAQGRLTLELVLGHFDPGFAFVDQDPAQKLELTARIGF